MAKTLLQPATPDDTRLKMFIYGGTGTGKTVTSLQFPSPAVIDAERGTEHYAKYFNFLRIFTSNPDEVLAVINELLDDPKDTKTFVIDPFTIIYDSIVQQRESIMKIKTGRADYILQPLDYKAIKSKLKTLTLQLLSLDMNIIVTAREKTMYSDDKNEFMKVVGYTHDGPKELPYLFDVVLRLTKKDDTFWAIVEKDRTNSLPPEFEFSYSSFVEYIGAKNLEREPVKFKQQEHLNAAAGRKFKIKFGKQELMTAGITADSLLAIQKLAEAKGEDVISNKLMEDYSITSALDLKEDEAQLLIKELSENK